jgi:NAD(P)-dependent dehydrogenase (short-subunit alcohol dehydrogenase family)
LTSLEREGANVRIWFITGASRGFGASIAAAALGRGDAVVATARNAADINARLGEQERLLALPLDVTHEAQAREAVAAALAHFGRIDILVNNAGYGLLGAVEEASAEEVERVFSTNVFGLLNVTRAVLPALRKQRSGHIINLSSIGGYTASSGWGIYSATKFAVEAISEALSKEAEPLGIHTTVVEPGYFRTDFLNTVSLATTATRIEDYADTVGRMRTFARGADHQQPGDPTKLADAILQLVAAAEPPRRLPLGSDTVRAIEDKHRAVVRELERWRALAESTDFVRSMT